MIFDDPTGRIAAMTGTEWDEWREEQTAAHTWAFELGDRVQHHRRPEMIGTVHERVFCDRGPLLEVVVDSYTPKLQRMFPQGMLIGGFEGEWDAAE